MARRKLTKVELFLEKVPPMAGVLLFFFPFVLSYFDAELAAYFIIILNVYFLYKSISFLVQFAISLLLISTAENTDWMRKVEGLTDIDSEILKLEKEKEFITSTSWSSFKKNNDILKITYRLVLFNKGVPEFLKRLVFNREKYKTLSFLNREIHSLKLLKSRRLIDYNQLQHVIIVPHVKEPMEILRQTLQHLQSQTYPSKYLNVVLAAEAADPNGVSASEQLKEEFKGMFNNIWITNHVLGEDEAVGKSANMAWAGRHAVEYIKELGWDLENVTITSCDADSKLPKQYFAYLTYKYITDIDSKYKYYNGALVLYNNIWRLPFYIRVKNSMSTIYNVGRLVRTDKLVPFSTYTTSFWLVDQIGYWTPWVTPEDFHMFFKALFMFGDKVETHPLYIKIMSDAAEGEGHWESIKNNYMQERRWAWGISDDGWILNNILFQWNKFSLRVKYIAFHVIFDHVFGPIGSLLILVGGNIPPLINPNFSKQVLGARLPGVSSNILQITLLCMAGVILLDFFLKPRPEKNNIITFITRILEWIVQPVAGFLLAVLPGLEAHTRLLFGKYLEYYVTKKKA